MTLLEKVIVIVLNWAMQQWLKKEQDEKQISKVTEAIDGFKTAKTREEKVAANKKLSDSLKP